MRRLFRWLVIALCTIVALILAVVIAGQFPDSSQKSSEGPSQPSKPEQPFHPNAIAKGLNAAPGAIVCPNLRDVNLLFGLYSDHWEQAMQSRLTNGTSEALNGPVPPAPNPANYGCWLLTPGTPVEVGESEGLVKGVPFVTARLPDGTVIRGSTLPAMLGTAPASH